MNGTADILFGKDVNMDSPAAMRQSPFRIRPDLWFGALLIGYVSPSAWLSDMKSAPRTPGRSPLLTTELVSESALHIK